jgi:hypothetical protein
MRVVHCKRDKFTHYIGRPSPLGNPFPVEPYGRTKAIELFEEHARKDGLVLAAIKALPEDAVLGCWCAPEACHGDVIIKLWCEMKVAEPVLTGIDAVMAKLPERSRHYWCKANGCACMGCANFDVIENGYTYEDWLQWYQKSLKA